MRIFWISVLLPVLCIITNHAQGQETSEEYFNEAQYFFNRSDYKEAAYFYKLLVERNPDHANFNFKLGECYMNIPGSELLAIPCFEKAITHTTPRNSYKKRSYYETSAPLHAWFYLGNVYRMNNQLEEALEAYNTFINSPFYYGNYNLNIVENEIKSCERAKIILDSPVNLAEFRLDTVINTSASEIYPVISGKDEILVFVRSMKFYDAVFCSFKSGENWSSPVNLNFMLGSDGDFYPVCLSVDGNELYLVRKTDDGSDLYVSNRSDQTWSKAQPLGKKINSKSDETWASLSSDKQILWFTSARKRGMGGLDIYYSRKGPDGKWGRAHNAGNIINTPFDEDSPCLINNDKTLFFSSKGHYSMGGYDIFYTDYNGEKWTEPVNLGYPLNNTSDNTGLSVLNNGKEGYNSRIIDQTGDIFKIILQSVQP